MTRRELIKVAALAAVGAPLVSRAESAAPNPKAVPKLGIAGYSLRKYTTDQAIEVLRKLHIDSAAVFKVHVPIGIGSPDVCRDAAKRFRDHGIRIYSTGVVYLENSESVMRRVFECGKAAGLSTMAASYGKPPDADTLKLTERFVKEYDIRLAFHNHGPEDKIFPSPYDIWRAVEPYDARMGLCLDIGHSARIGVDPIEAIHRCSARIHDVHFKDTVAPIGAVKDQPVGLGFGRLDLRGILAALLEVGYSDTIGLEDEVESDDPEGGLAQSFGYLRGLLKGLVPTIA